MDFSNYITRAYQTAKKNGFHDEEHSTEHYLCLIISELMEMVQADRKKKKVFVDYNAMIRIWRNNKNNNNIPYLYNHLLSGTMEEELADTLIRIFDFAEHYNIKITADVDIDITPYLGAITTTEWVFNIISVICESERNAVIGEGLNIVATLLFQYAEVRKIPLLEIVSMKMEYNETRPRLHNCKY